MHSNIVQMIKNIYSSSSGCRKCYETPLMDSTELSRSMIIRNHSKETYCCGFWVSKCCNTILLCSMCMHPTLRSAVNSRVLAASAQWCQRLRSVIWCSRMQSARCFLASHTFAWLWLPLVQGQNSQPQHLLQPLALTGNHPPTKDGWDGEENRIWRGISQGVWQ